MKMEIATAAFCFERAVYVLIHDCIITFYKGDFPLMDPRADTNEL